MEIKIKVKTNKSKQSIVKEDENYIVNLKSSPIENKANKELIKLFKKELGLDVRIKRGLRSKDKILEVVQPKII